MDDRHKELLERLVASGPKCCAVSTSECHEIVEYARKQQEQIDDIAEALKEWDGLDYKPAYRKLAFKIHEALTRSEPAQKESREEG